MAQQQQQKQVGNNPDRAIVHETNKEFQELADDMAVLKEAVTDMATLVSEQTEDLEHSQKNVQQTQVTVEKAEKDLKDAEYHQNSSRKKCIIL